MEETLCKNGRMPLVGLGCFFSLPVDQADVEKWVEQAVDSGYRHFDTAWLYQTEKTVGRVINAKIEAGVFKREDVFITSKLSFFHHKPDEARKCVRESLSNLNTHYIDLYLIHVPVSLKKQDDLTLFWELGTPTEEHYDNLGVWKVLEEFVKEGTIKSIGVSNFNISQLQDILDHGTIKPVVNQVEVQVYYQNKELVDYCKKNSMQVTAYSPLARPSAQALDSGIPFKDQLIEDLATKYRKTAAQIALKFLVQQGIAVVPTSRNITRQQENLQLFDFEITKEDMVRIEALDRKEKFLKMEQLIDHRDYPFHGDS